MEVSAYGVAALYKDFIDAFFIDLVDKAQEERIRALGIHVSVRNTIMRSLEDSIQLAKEVLKAVESL